MRTLREIGRETYGHDARAINRHADRAYEDKAGNRYVLSRTLDGIPPFFEAYGPFKAGHEGVLPRLKVQGKEYWGDGCTWQRALRVFCAELGATITKANKMRNCNETSALGN
jgi:hypothetical protein